MLRTLSIYDRRIVVLSSLFVILVVYIVLVLDKVAVSKFKRNVALMEVVTFHLHTSSTTLYIQM